MMKRIFILGVMLLTFSSCVHAPLSVSKEKRFTDTYWFGLSDRIVTGSNLTTDGKNLYFGTSRGTLYALSGKNGKVLWKKDLEGAIDSTPAISDGQLFVGTSKGKFYCLNQNKGEQVWIQNVSGDVLGTPTVTQDKLVLMGANDGFLYALDTATGDQRWRFKKDLPDRITIQGFSSPAFSSGKIFVAFADGSVSSLREQDGTELWGQKLPNSSRFGDVVSPILLSGDQLMVAQYGGSLFGMDQSGTLKWNVTDGGSAGKITKVDGTLFVPGASSQLMALKESTGGNEWTTKVEETATWSGTAATSKFFLATSYEGFLYVLDRRTGKQIWKYQLGAPIQGSPVVLEDRIWVLTRKGVLFRF